MAATIQTVMVNILVLGINFGTGIITARALGPDGRGEQAAMQMWPSIFAFAFTLGLPSALLYNLRRYPEIAPRLFSAALLIGTGMGLLAALVGAAVIPYWLTQYPPEVVSFAQWLMLFSPLILLNVVFSAVLRAREEFTAFNAVRYLIPTFTLLILVSLALTHRLTPLNAAVAYVLAHVPISLWLMVRLSRAYRLTLRGLRGASYSITSYGIRSYGVDLLGHLVAGQLDRVLVVGLLDPAAMGTYVVALSMARVLDVFPSAVAFIVLPKTASRPVEEVVALVGRGVRASTSVTVLAGAVLVILGPWALASLYGREFLSAVPVFRLLVAQAVLGGATWVLSQAFMASNRPGTVSIMQAIGVGLTVPLLIVLVPRYGLVGAGLAMLISTAARFVFVLVSFPMTLGIRPPGLRPRWSDFTSTVYRRGSDGGGKD